MPKQKHAGIIDLGTNTFHLLIARYDKHWNHEILERKQVPVKIGKGGIQHNKITPEAYDRAVNAIAHLKEVMEGYSLDELRIIGTSALRGAHNSKAFLDDVENMLKHGVQIIDGEDEARLIYYGVKMASGLSEDPSLILDIGGGSVELIIGNHREMIWKGSFEIGAARLIAHFPHDFPIKKDQAEAIQNHVAEVLEPFRKTIEKYPVQNIIGASGSFETFVQLEHHLRRQKPPEILPVLHQIDPAHLKKLKEKIYGATKSELHQMPGMADFRVDMMVVATLIVDYIQQLTGVETVYFSDYAMKEGALWAFLNEEL